MTTLVVGASGATGRLLVEHLLHQGQAVRIIVRGIETLPETIINHDIHPSPTRSAIFDAGTTSRINVAHFMSSLITNPKLWEKWKGKMPVIYNRT